MRKLYHSENKIYVSLSPTRSVIVKDFTRSKSHHCYSIRRIKTNIYYRMSFLSSQEYYSAIGTGTIALSSSNRTQRLRGTCVFHLCRQGTKLINAAEVELEGGELSHPTPRTTPRSGVRPKRPQQKARRLQRNREGREEAF